MSKPKSTKKNKPRKPRILVLESAGGSATNAVLRSGALPLRVDPRNVQAVDEALAHGFDGMLLTGGGDVDPRLYGEKPHKQVYGVNETRDYTEWCALDRAKELGVPVMGICRGMQLIAVHNGGKLKQHIPGHRGTNHLVHGEPGSKFNRVIGHERGSFPSLHHQIVARHGKGLTVAARSREGFIEAIEGPNVLAVQFHPEYDYGTNEASRKLFDWLAQAAARKARVAKPTRMKVTKKQAPTFGRQLTYSRPTSLGQAATRKRKTPAGDKHAALTSRWFCRECGMKFDVQNDRDDHEHWLHGEPVIEVRDPKRELDWSGHDHR